MELSIAFKHYLKTHSLEKKRVGIAISGGLDSIVLAHLFLHFSNARLELLHVNYGLRAEESEEDEDFLLNFSEKNGIPIRILKGPAYLKNSKGIQEKARKIRYEWFEQLIQNQALDYIATAHHQNDNAETVLFRLIRKTGLRGLVGISEHDHLLRPLLHFNKEQISNYALQNKLIWREDSSNAKLDYSRNSLRHLVVYPLTKHFPHAVENIHQTAIQLNNTQSVLSDLLALYKKQYFLTPNKCVFKIHKKDLASFRSPALLLFFLIENMQFNLPQCEEMWLALQNNRKGASWYHGPFEVCVHNQKLVFVQSKNENAPHLIKIEWSSCAHFTLKHPWFKLKVESNPNTTFTNKDFCLRFWKQGDKMQYTANGNHKKLSDIFSENKIPVVLRNKLPVLLYKNNIIKIAGINTSEVMIPLELKKKAVKIELHTLLLFDH
jgi:tRNA(Ile)-lysidine synthase